MARKIIDPITRLEGHLRIEVELDSNNTVTDAWSSGTLWRGLENILKGRPPQDAPLIVQRFCGVCTYSHYEASTLANEDAFGVTPPKNARIIRNLIKAAQWLHDHSVHFYVLHGLDWVDIVSALSANPRSAVDVAKSVSDNPYNVSVRHYRAVQKRLQSLVDSGRLGIFANGYWGNSSYKLSPEANLVITSHYLDVLSVQRKAAQAMAIFGGKNPHPQSLIIGGVTPVVDALDAERVGLYLSLVKEVKDFVERAYLPDVLLAAPAYADEGLRGDGAGPPNYLVYGAFPQSEYNQTPFPDALFPGGIVWNNDLTKFEEVDPDKIMEHVKHSWYEGEEALHPSVGKTEPDYTGFTPSGNVDGSGKYSWVKAPRYDDQPVQMGPLARMIVGYARDDSIIKPAVENLLNLIGTDASILFSTLGRTAARCLESVILAGQIETWVDELTSNISGGDTTFWNATSIPTGERSGYGLTDVPRGALGHWVTIKDGKIERYQAVVPSTWNASPRDANENRGAYEESLIGIQLSNPDEPLEIIRTIHSFDPCLACAIHIITPKGDVKKFQIS